jgi:hypothetical protein
MCEKGGFFKKGFDANKVRWSTGQIETDEFSADDLTILRAFEWDRINFTNQNKLENICRMMGITLSDMDIIRKKTLANAINLIRSNDGVSPKIREMLFSAIGSEKSNNA